jgi:hypothetical protein
MATFTKFKLSGSTNGRGIVVAATASAGTTLHVATNDADTLDEVWLEAVNHTSSSIDLTIEAGGTASGDRIEVAIPPQQGLVRVLDGHCFSGGVTIAAFASVASGISIFGDVNRIVQS